MKRENLDFLHRLCGVLEIMAAAVNDETDRMSNLQETIYNVLEVLERVIKEESGGDDDGKTNKG